MAIPDHAGNGQILNSNDGKLSCQPVAEFVDSVLPNILNHFVEIGKLGFRFPEIGAALGFAGQRLIEATQPGTQCAVRFRSFDELASGKSREGLQAKVHTDDAKIDGGLKPFVGLHENSDVPAIGPVSYTHLDVYKRQLLFCAPATAVFSATEYRAMRSGGLKLYL